MKGRSPINRWVMALCLVATILSVLVVSTSCSSPKTTNSLTSALAETKVPDLDLDVYLYFKQATPTVLPASLFNTASDMSLDSVAVWGLVDGIEYAIGAALNFSNTEDAASFYSALPAKTALWTQLNESTIYMAYGVGLPFDSLKTAVSNNDFIKYNDKSALTEIAGLPYSDTNRPLMVGVIKPNQNVINFATQYTDVGAAHTLDEIATWVKPRVLVLGCYSSQPITIADIQDRYSNDAIWEMQIGLIVSVNSSFPGIIFSPVADKYLSNQGYQKISLTNMKVYQTQINDLDNRNVPVLVNINGNHIYAALSTSLNYTKMLIGSLKK